MRRIFTALAAFVAGLGIAASAQAQTPAQHFSDWVAGLPVASPPYVGSDLQVLVRGGVPYQVPGTVLRPPPGVFDATRYGSCVWDGASGHDVGPCINLAIAAAASAGGGSAICPAGNYYIATTVSVTASYVGLSCGVKSGTTLSWNGAAQGRMVSFVAPYGDTSKKRLAGNSIDLWLNGNGLAADGLHLESLFNWDLRFRATGGFSGAGAATNGTTAAGNATLHFAATPAWITRGMSVSDATAPTVLPKNAMVMSTTGTTVVLNVGAAGAGVGSGDTINFAGNVLNLDVAPALNGTTFGEPIDTQDGRLYELDIQVTGTSNQFRLGAYLDTVSGNASLNTIYDHTIVGTGGIGILCFGCDNNFFYTGRVFNAGTSVDLIFAQMNGRTYAPNGNNFAHQHYTGAFIARGQPTLAGCTAYSGSYPVFPDPSVLCTFWNWVTRDATNGTPLPTIEAGAELKDANNGGYLSGLSFPGVSGVRPGAIFTHDKSIIGACETNAYAYGALASTYLCNTSNGELLYFDDLSGDRFSLRFGGSGGTSTLQLLHPAGTGKFEIQPDTRFYNGVALTSTVPSTSAGTGALVVTGGVGIGGALYIGGNFTGAGVLATGAPVATWNGQPFRGYSDAGATLTTQISVAPAFSFFNSGARYGFGSATDDGVHTVQITGSLSLNGVAVTGGPSITALTGDVTATGPGSVAATIATNAVTNAKAAQMANGTVKCRTTAGTGNPEDCTTVPTAALPALTGDVTTSAGSTVTTLAAGSASNLNSGTLPNARLPAGASWTPTDASGAALTFTSVSANYIQLGPLIFAWGALTYPATADPSNAAIGGLPVAAANQNYAQNLVQPAGAPAGTVLQPQKNTSTAFFWSNSALAARKTNAQMTGVAISFLLIYPAS